MISSAYVKHGYCERKRGPLLELTFKVTASLPSIASEVIREGLKDIIFDPMRCRIKNIKATVRVIALVMRISTIEAAPKERTFGNCDNLKRISCSFI